MSVSNRLGGAKVEMEGDENAAFDAFQELEIQGDVVMLHSFQIRNADIAGYLTSLTTDDRAQAFIRAVEVGVFCLERASTAKDTEFMKRQIERLIGEVDLKVGAIPTRVEAELVKKVGTGDGQVLKPILDASELASRDVKQRIADCRTLLTDIDPTKESSSVGKALKSLKDLLDPKRMDSVQGSLEAAITKVSGADGALAQAVKAKVDAALQPLIDELKELGKEIRGQEAAEEMLMQTTEKGQRYEEVVIDVLQPWAEAVGAELERVGADNRPGDVVVNFTPNSLCSSDFRVVIEVRDESATRRGRKVIATDLSNAMAERSANAGIYLSRTSDGLGQEIGDWAEGAAHLGPWVAVTHDNLRTALRFLIAQERVRTLRSELPELDTAAIENYIARIRTALDRVKTIKTKITNMRSAADNIGTEADNMRDEILSALRTVEEAVQRARVPEA